MPDKDYKKIADLLTDNNAWQYRLLPNGGIVVVTKDGRRLSFTPAEVTEADLAPVILNVEKDLKAEPKLPRVQVQPTPTVIIQHATKGSPATREQVPSDRIVVEHRKVVKRPKPKSEILTSRRVRTKDAEE